MAGDTQRSRAILLVGLALGVATGCKPDDPAPRVREPSPEPEDLDEPRYPAIDPASVTPLEVVMLPDPVGEGYRRVPIRMSKSLHSGKWLGLANGDAEFFGPKHIIVNHFERQPDRLGEGDLIKNVVLDVETGKVVAEYAYGRHVQADFGLAIVFQEGDERPYLLDAATEKFVLAVPEGEHEFVYGDNYVLRFSPIAKRLWVTARDKQDVLHLYAWEQLDAPPELPNNPFPFVPDQWDPLDSMYSKPGDTEEVVAGPNVDGCQRALLEPPKGWVCIADGELLRESTPLSEGWRLDRHREQVFNRDDGRGYDLTSLCPEEHPMFASIRWRSPPQLSIRCSGDDSVWMLWTPPDRVRKLDPQYPERIHKDLSLYDHDGVPYLLVKPIPSDIQTNVDSKRLIQEIVGIDYDCPDLQYRNGNLFASALVCRRDMGRALWAELQSDERRLRSRFQATEVVASPDGLVVAIVRRGNRDHIVRVSQ
jgi:hypothetical protein